VPISCKPEAFSRVCPFFIASAFIIVNYEFGGCSGGGLVDRTSYSGKCVIGVRSQEPNGANHEDSMPDDAEQLLHEDLTSTYEKANGSVYAKSVFMRRQTERLYTVSSDSNCRYQFFESICF
jgi:hypothetical protein